MNGSPSSAAAKGIELGRLADAAVSQPAAPVAAAGPPVPDPAAGEILHSLQQTWAEAGGLVGQAWGWLSSHILTPAGLLQIGILAAALLIAGGLAQRLTRRLRPPPPGPAGRAPPGRAADRLVVLAPLALPVLWLLLVAVGRAGFAWAEEPAPLIQIAERLLVAWVVIRGATALVAGHFWSRLITWGVLAYTLAFVLGLEPVLIEVLDDVAISVGSVRLSLLAALRGFIVLAVFFWLASLALRLVERWLLTMPDLTASARVLVEKLIRAAVVIVAVLAALHAMGIDATAITVFGGAVGLGIGFGLQQIVANLISGFILLLDRSVKPGDVIAVGDKFGWINAIGARYVSVLTRDGIEHLIPNEQLITNRVENWSHSNSLVRLHAPLGIAYDASVRDAIRLAEQAAGETDRVLRQPPPQCLLRGFGDSAVQLDLLFWISDPKNGLDTVTSDVLLRVWDLYHQAGIGLPFPQRDLHLKTAVPITVVPPV